VKWHFEPHAGETPSLVFRQPRRQQ
jgi:hypothetical protein